MVPFPHYKNNKQCPNYGKSPLPEPGAYAPPRTVRLHRSAPLLAGSEDDGSESEDGDHDSASEDGNDNVCHECGETGELLVCDECPRVWHYRCLPAAALALAEAEPWQCPVCARISRPAGFIGNPARAPPGRGGGQHQKRYRSAIEGTKSQRKRRKAAGRIREVRFR